MEELRVAIIDSGTDLQNLYRGDRHHYQAVWVSVEELSWAAISGCHLLIIPTGSDNTLLAAKKDVLWCFLNQGGWIFCFDGIVEGLFDGVQWSHSTTDYKQQTFRIMDSDWAFLLDGVCLEGLAVKDGVRGWWCEGELLGEGLTPLLADQHNRIVAGIRPPHNGSGAMVATAAGRLPLYSADPTLAANVFWGNLLAFCRASMRVNREVSPGDIYLHSGNWSHRSFLTSDQFGHRLTGVHWGCLDASALAGARSVWVPWESNIRALQRSWPLLERAVSQGTTLVVEDLRGNWLPGFHWEHRPVDSSWWREGRELDLIVRDEAARIFPGMSARAFRWHYHGVFDCPGDTIPLLTTRDGKAVLALQGSQHVEGGIKLVSTLDATFEYGTGKIPETAMYIEGVLNLLSDAHTVGRLAP